MFTNNTQKHQREHQSHFQNEENQRIKTRTIFFQTKHDFDIFGEGESVFKQQIILPFRYDKLATRSLTRRMIKCKIFSFGIHFVKIQQNI